LLDGTPLLIPCAEGWRALIDPTFRGIIEKQLRTIRSRDGAVVFITQSPRDIIDSDIVNILVEQCTPRHCARGHRRDRASGHGASRQPATEPPRSARAPAPGRHPDALLPPVSQCAGTGGRADPRGSAWWGLRASADGAAPGYRVVVFGGRHADVPITAEMGAALGR
jgi:hypothetical protein